MASAAVARRYGKALFQLAREENRVEAVRGELAVFAAAVDGQAELAAVLFRPLYPVAERRGVLTALARSLELSPLVQHFLAYLVDQRRIIDFPGIRAAFELLADALAGRLRAEVLTVNPLSAEKQERLRRVLATRVGQDVELIVKVDPALIGGVIVRVKDLVFDGSLRSQLRQLHANLTKGHGLRWN